MTKRLLTLFPLAFALLPSEASAFKHTYQVWCDPEDLPIPFYLGDYEEDSVPAGFTRIANQAGFDAWTRDAPCAGLGGEYAGLADNTSWISNDGETHITFDDPGDDNAAGVLAATVTVPQGGGRICFVRDGSAYYSITDSDIVFNDNVDFATDEEIESNQCNGETSMQSVATHEIGHLFGMGHSCDQGDACTNTAFRQATMYWTGGTCDASGSTLGEDDIEGINRIYGPSAAVECSNELDPTDPDTIAFGVIPFDLKCSVVSDNRDEVDGVSWSWGDGTSDEGLDVSHTYETPGNFTVQAQVSGTNDECGTWTSTSRKVGYVRACAVPEPEFSYGHLDGLEYTLLNNTDVSVYGCIYDIEWDIFPPGGGDPVRLKAWEPKYTFPEEGDYRVVLNIGGPAGTGAAELIVPVKNSRGEGYGCNAGTAGLGVGGALIGFAALLARRRR